MVDMVKAVPYDWPYDGVIEPSKTALLVIDMQHDFCGPGGYVDRMGYDICVTSRVIASIKAVLDTVRRIPRFTVLYTREGHRLDLADLPANKRWRSQRIGAGVGDPGPSGRILARGEPGWEIVAELKAEPHELILDKPSKGSFYATDLDLTSERAASPISCSPALRRMFASTPRCAKPTIAVMSVCCSMIARERRMRVTIRRRSR
jgi:hypothetical protein